MAVDVFELAVKLLALGPLVYAGMVMAVEPERCLTWVNAVATVLIRFRHGWWGPVVPPAEVHASRWTLLGMRVAGLAGAVFAVSHIVGLAG